MINLAIAGAAGRMGRRIGSLAGADEELEVVCPLERSDSEAIGKDYGELLGVGESGVKVCETLSGDPNVIIDFSSPESTLEWVEVAGSHGVSMVIGTTGLDDDQLDKIKSCASDIPIVQAPNMSMGVNLLFRMVGQIAKSLGRDYDVEIVEAHHRFKKDSPSGTALGLLKSVCNGLDVDPDDAAVYGRCGKDAQREKGQIGVHAVRLGDTVGEHSVHFGTLGETVTISHSAHSRDTFVQGALCAAKWLAGKKPGLYSMEDVLFG